MAATTTAEAIRDRFEGDGYVAFHAPRYETLLQLLQRAGTAQARRVLDIGNSPLTELLAEAVSCPVDNLGLDGDFDTPHGHSYWYDLNFTSQRDRWKTDLPRYDLIVMAEVIEHLYTAPQTVLAFLRTLLTDRGALVIQTPNAAVLHNRVQMLAGHNPFEMIRETTNDPGHFREYTRKELVEVCRQAGLEPIHWSAHSYFDYRYMEGSPTIARLGSLLNLLYRLVPPTMRPGQTLLARPRP